MRENTIINDMSIQVAPYVQLASDSTLKPAPTFVVDPVDGLSLPKPFTENVNDIIADLHGDFVQIQYYVEPSAFDDGRVFLSSVDVSRGIYDVLSLVAQGDKIATFDVLDRETGAFKYNIDVVAAGPGYLLFAAPLGDNSIQHNQLIEFSGGPECVGIKPSVMYTDGMSSSGEISILYVAPAGDLAPGQYVAILGASNEGENIFTIQPVLPECSGSMSNIGLEMYPDHLLFATLFMKNPNLLDHNFEMNADPMAFEMPSITNDSGL